MSAPIAENLAAELGQRRVRWGHKRDVRRTQDAGQLAGYLAKYSTKSTEQAGGLLHPIAPEGVEYAKVTEHVRYYLREACRLDAVAQREAAKHKGEELIDAQAQTPRPATRAQRAQAWLSWALPDQEPRLVNPLRRAAPSA